MAPTPQSAPSCDRCRRPAVEAIRYAGVHLCGDHLVDFVTRRVKKTLRDQGGIPTGARIGVAVSGGKDSIVALRLLHQILLPRLGAESGGENPRGDVSLVVLTVDEGIAGYRAPGLEIAAAAAAELGLAHHVTGYQDLVGVTMDQVHTVKGERNECSFCGVFRRSALNHLARAADCDLVVTGHNLDDTAQAVLMNVTGGDVARLARLGPHTDVKDGLVPRRMPLRMIPEKEVYLTAMFSGWTHDHGECPYASNSQRFRYRDLLGRMEADDPGTRHSLVKTLERLRPVLPQLEAAKGTPLVACTQCGEPASDAVCRTCVLGNEVRTALAES